MLPAIFFSVFYYTDTKKALQNEINSANIESLSSICDTTDAVIYELQQFVLKTSTDDDTKIFMISENADFNNMTLWDKLRQSNLSFKNIYDYINSIYIYSETNDGIISNNEYFSVSSFSDKDWIACYKNSSDDGLRTFLRNINNAYPPVITILKPVKFSGRFVGAVAVNIDVERLSTLKNFGSDDDGAYNILIDNGGKIIYSKNKGFLNKSVSELSEENILNCKKPTEISRNNEKYVFFSKNPKKAICITPVFIRRKIILKKARRP